MVLLLLNMVGVSSPPAGVAASPSGDSELWSDGGHICRWADNAVVFSWGLLIYYGL